MILAFISIATGAALFLLMLAWRNSDIGLDSAELGGPSDPSIMRRIIAQEDLLYVASLHMPRIRHFFVRERRRLALDWLRSARQEALRLLRDHVEAVRRLGDLRPAAEVRIGAAFASFLCVYTVTAAMVYLFGPFRVPVLLRSGEYLFDSLEALGRTISGVAALEDGRA